jgi:hypothetical protein
MPYNRNRIGCNNNK